MCVKTSGSLTNAFKQRQIKSFLVLFGVSKIAESVVNAFKQIQIKSFLLSTFEVSKTLDQLKMHSNNYRLSPF